MKLSEMYFKASNGHIQFSELIKYVQQYSGEEYDVVAFGRGKSKLMGFSTTVMPVSLIGVGADELEYGFRALDK